MKRLFSSFTWKIVLDLVFPLTSLAFIELYILVIAMCVICFMGKIALVHTSVVMYN